MGGRHRLREGKKKNESRFSLSRPFRWGSGYAGRSSLYREIPVGTELKENCPFLRRNQRDKLNKCSAVQRRKRHEEMETKERKFATQICNFAQYERVKGQLYSSLTKFVKYCGFFCSAAKRRHRFLQESFTSNKSAFSSGDKVLSEFPSARFKCLGEVSLVAPA